MQLTDSYHEFGTDARDETAELPARKVTAPNPAALLHVPTLSAGTVTDHPRNERYGTPTVEGIDRADVSDTYREDFAAGRDGNPVSTRGGWENVPASNEVSRGAW